jgi:S-DNA-T family DNA segregation ATPase FtsK/SpoIIIE
MPHTDGLLTDLDAQLGERALTALKAELHHRERRLREVGADNITAYRRLGLPEPMPRLVVVIDEFATLAKELPDFVTSLVDVAQRGRTLGVHLVLATQRPSGAVNENIKANTNLRIALQMLDAGESKDIVDVGDAAGITRKGRALVRLSRRDLVPMQTALITCVTREHSDRAVTVAPFTYGPHAAPTTSRDDADRGRTDLDRLVDAIIDATALEEIPPPRRPWPEPLPAEIPLDALAGGSSAGEGPVAVVACADDPARQEQYPVGWALAEGNLLLLGVPGSGTTTTLASIALALATVHAPAELELHVLDFGVGELAPLAGLAHIGSVVLAGDRERQVRLLRHLVAEFARRRTTGPDRRLVVLVDNLPAMRAAFDDAAGTDLMAQFARVVADGQGAGISVVLTADRPQSVPTAFATTQQWLFRLADTIDYTYAGIDRRNVPAATPGRAVVTGTSPHRGLHIQVGRPLPGLAEAVAQIAGRRPDAARVAHAIAVLPTRVAFAELGGAARITDRPWVIPVGTAESDLGVAALQLYDEEHALIAGPARSGRSTALWTVAESLRRADRPIHLAGIGGPRSPLRDCPALDRYAATPGEAAALLATLRTVGGPVALLVDDADRLDDAGGALDLLFSAPVAGLHVIAAGNNDGLRTLYGHWTKTVRAARSGLLLRPNVHMDGDLLGTMLPARAPVEMVTGRGYLVTNGEAVVATRLTS